MNENIASEKELRSYWQHHENTIYCLYGSRKQILLELLNTESRALYRFGDLFLLDKIPEKHWVKYIVDSFSGTGKIKLAMRVADSNLTHTVVPTGKTVGEPSSNWAIDSFESHRMGRVNFPMPGFYEIELEIQLANKAEGKFQWIWIK